LYSVKRVSQGGGRKGLKKFYDIGKETARGERVTTPAWGNKFRHIDWKMRKKLKGCEKKKKLQKTSPRTQRGGRKKGSPPARGKEFSTQSVKSLEGRTAKDECKADKKEPWREEGERLGKVKKKPSQEMEEGVETRTPLTFSAEESNDERKKEETGERKGRVRKNSGFKENKGT